MFSRMFFKPLLIKSRMAFAQLHAALTQSDPPAKIQNG